MLDQMRVPEGGPAGLASRNPDDTLGLTDKKAGEKLMKQLVAELEVFQQRLWAEDRRSVLLVLQGMDTSGKDGTIRKVLGQLNPQGVRVDAFRKPSTNELDRDYLWRVHAATPRRGEIGVFNRSHYEDVGVVRVFDIVPESVWRPRYRHIRDFENLLEDEGTHVAKVWLHISKHEQKLRLQERLDTPEKRWKFETGDLAMRERWDDFLAAYDEALAETSTERSPWYVVPADRKWVRNIAVASILLEELRRMDPREPAPDDLAGITIPD